MSEQASDQLNSLPCERELLIRRMPPVIVERTWYERAMQQPWRRYDEIEQRFAFRVGSTVVASSAGVKALGGDKRILSDDVFLSLPERPAPDDVLARTIDYMKTRFDALDEVKAEVTDLRAYKAKREAADDTDRDQSAADASESATARKERLQRKLDEQRRRRGNPAPSNRQTSNGKGGYASIDKRAS